MLSGRGNAPLALESPVRCLRQLLGGGKRAGDVGAVTLSVLGLLEIASSRFLLLSQTVASLLTLLIRGR
jgi:hypothetical protein